MVDKRRTTSNQAIRPCRDLADRYPLLTPVGEYAERGGGRLSPAFIRGPLSAAPRTLLDLGRRLRASCRPLRAQLVQRHRTRGVPRVAASLPIGADGCERSFFWTSLTAGSSSPFRRRSGSSSGRSNHPPPEARLCRGETPSSPYRRSGAPDGGRGPRLTTFRAALLFPGPVGPSDLRLLCRRERFVVIIRAAKPCLTSLSVVFYASSRRAIGIILAKKRPLTAGPQN